MLDMTSYLVGLNLVSYTTIDIILNLDKVKKSLLDILEESLNSQFEFVQNLENSSYINNEEYLNFLINVHRRTSVRNLNKSIKDIKRDYIFLNNQF